MDNDLIERLRTVVRQAHPDWSSAPVIREAIDALEAARADACVALVADIRWACGDKGKRMQPELVEYVRELARDAGRYRWIRSTTAPGYMHFPNGEMPDGLALDALDAAIDAAMAAEGRDA